MNPEIIKKLQIHFSHHESIKVLDLGCGVFNSLPNLIINLNGIKKIVAVDDDRDGTIKNYYNALDNLINNFPNILKSKVEFKLKCRNKPNDNLDFNFTSSSLAILSIEDFFKHRSYHDLILLKNVLHYYTKEEDILKVLESVHDSLEENGVVFVEVASENHPYNEDPNKSTFTLESLKGFLISAKLAVLKHEYFEEGSNIFAICQKAS